VEWIEDEHSHEDRFLAELAH